MVIRKKNLIQFCICFVSLFFAFCGSANAQNIGVNLDVVSQSILDHNVPIDLAINSNIALSQVKVQWILPYGLTTTFGERSSYTTSITSTDPFQDHFVIVPQYAGTYNVTADISGIYNGTQFNKSGSLYLTFDTHLHLVNAVSQESATGITNLDIYNIKRGIYILLCCVLFLVFVFLLKDVYNYGKLKFTSWLNKDS